MADDGRTSVSGGGEEEPPPFPDVVEEDVQFHVVQHDEDENTGVEQEQTVSKGLLYVHGYILNTNPLPPYMICPSPRILCLGATWLSFVLACCTRPQTLSFTFFLFFVPSSVLPFFRSFVPLFFSFFFCNTPFFQPACSSVCPPCFSFLLPLCFFFFLSPFTDPLFPLLVSLLFGR